MKPDNQSQGVLDTDKPGTVVEERPAKDDRPSDGQSAPEETSPEATRGTDGPPQPMAHPPEDTFVGEDTHLRPGQKIDR